MKKIIVFCLLSVMMLVSLSAVDIYVKGGYAYTYDTNVFSDPLVKNASVGWLNWRVDNPYVKRHNNGFLAETDFFFAPEARTGLSLSLNGGIPFKTTEYIPDGDFNRDWYYKEVDALEKSSTSLFAAVGPIFRAKMGIVDMGLSLRASFGTYDYTVPEIVCGLMVEPYVNVFVTDDLFLSMGMHYDAHLMSFYTRNQSEIFRDKYVMMTVGGYLGAGICFGERD